MWALINMCALIRMEFGEAATLCAAAGRLNS